MTRRRRDAPRRGAAAARAPRRSARGGTARGPSRGSRRASAGASPATGWTKTTTAERHAGRVPVVGASSPCALLRDDLRAARGSGNTATTFVRSTASTSAHHLVRGHVVGEERPRAPQVAQLGHRRRTASVTTLSATSCTVFPVPELHAGPAATHATRSAGEPSRARRRPRLTDSRGRRGAPPSTSEHDGERGDALDATDARRARCSCWPSRSRGRAGRPMSSATRAPASRRGAARASAARRRPSRPRCTARARFRAHQLEDPREQHRRRRAPPRGVGVGEVLAEVAERARRRGRRRRSRGGGRRRRCGRAAPTPRRSARRRARGGGSGRTDGCRSRCRRARVALLARPRRGALGRPILRGRRPATIAPCRPTASC